MAGLDGFNIFGDDVQVNHHVDEVPEVQGLAQGNGAIARLNWTPVMSTYVLSKFSDLVCEGVRIDKGFKDCHVNAVARELQSYISQQVSGTQVYSHLCKWRTKWVKICRLKDLSAANWDEDLCMIIMDPEHYRGHVKVIATNTVFACHLSVVTSHLIHYCVMKLTYDHCAGSFKGCGVPQCPYCKHQYMQTIFCCGVATGRFAMGSNQALGQPAAE